MRHPLKMKIEFIVIGIALITAMFFQYLRISQLDISFIHEVSISSTLVYLLVIFAIPVLILILIFLPLLLVFEITLNIEFPKSFEIKISREIFSIKSVARKYTSKSKYITVFRC